MKTKSLDLDKLNSKDPGVKYGFAKELIKMGKTDPTLLYDHFDSWSDLLKSEKNILRWTAIDILGYISTVDNNRHIPGQIDNLFGILHSGNLITSNHAIFALGLIARNIPDQKARIIKELTTIQRDKFETEECKAIATGKVIETLRDFPEEILDNKEILDFIKNAQFSQRNATRNKANSLMKRLSK